MLYNKLTRNEKAALDIVMCEYPRHKSFNEIIETIKRSKIFTTEWYSLKIITWSEFDTWSSYHVIKLIKDTKKHLDEEYPIYKDRLYYDIT